MIGRLFVLLLLSSIALTAHARDGVHTIPGTVFVGDRAILIVPVWGFPGQGDTELPPAQLPGSRDVDIHRVALERRPGGNRLAVEFVAFAPGILELPPIEVAGETFEGLTVRISSVLGPSEPPILSPPALPLAVPGTALLVYGTIAAIVLSLLFASLVSLKGPLWFRGLLIAWRRRRMISAMLGAERRLRKALAKGAAPRPVLDELSGEFRAFLSGFSGENCLAMTAREIGRLPPPRTPDGRVEYWDGEFLERFFARCDRVRFSGRAVGGNDALEIMGELGGFLQALNRAPVAEAEKIPGAKAA